jgi:pimeloyl-ACP methyl ester carboxylesterase
MAYNLGTKHQAIMPQNATLSVFVFVPGAGHSSACYAAVRAGLAAHGHETVGVELPSVGAGPVQRDLSADVAAVRGAVAPLVAAGREVVVVMHSYGGIPGSDALKGLGRGEGGAPLGGVVGLVYLMSFLIEEGVRVCGERGDVSGFRPYHQLDLEVRLVFPLVLHSVPAANPGS